MKTINVQKTLFFVIFLFTIFSGSLVIGATQQKFSWPMFLPAIINNATPPPGSTVAIFGVATYSTNFVFGP